MSRTKCVLSGPVSGTAAGRPAYQPAGSASIHTAFSRLPTAKTARHQNQKSVVSARCIGSPFRPARREAGSDGSGATPRGHVIADDGGEARDAVADGVGLD